MAPGSLLGFLLVSCVLTNEVVSQKPLEVSPGQNVTLPCNITETIQDIREVTVEWERNGSYVVVFVLGGKAIEQGDHFKNRAEMADPELKNGNLAMILRNIQLSDSGTYDCFFLGSGSRKKRSTDDLITSVTLKVKAVSKEPLEVSQGKNVILPCTTTEKIQDIRKVTVEWERNGSYVVVFRSGKDVSADQDDHFKNRAELADPELKNGNLSMILRNIQLSDSGTYDCFFLGSGSRKKRSTDDLITSVTLKVKEKTPESQISLESETGFGSGTGNGGDQAETGERTRLGLELTVGLAVFAVFAVFAVVLFVHVFPKFRTRQSNKEPTESSEQSVRLSETE